MRKVTLENITAGMRLAKAVYSADGKNLLEAGQELKPFFVKKLQQLGIHTVYVEDGRFDDIEIADVISEQTRREAVGLTKQILQYVNRDGMDLDKLSKNTIEISKTVEKIVSDILANRNLVVNLQDIRSYDEYIYFHSVNVCVLSVIIGTVLKLKFAQLVDLGVGALLHDIGKMKLPIEILNKPGKLNEEEFSIIQKHTLYGYDLLRKKREISLLSAHIALQHHERQDGTGYPRGLKGSEIHQYARIVNVADAYDALISFRIYRAKKYLPHEAIEMIYAATGTHFDPEVVTAFSKNIAIYPLGSYVVLSTGEKGVVIDVNQSCITRPVIRITEDADGNSLPGLKEIYLDKELTTFIVDVLA